MAGIERKYEELTAQLSSPEVLADNSRYQKIAKALSDISEVVEKYRRWKAIDKSMSGAKELLADASTDEEMRALAHEEFGEMEQQRVQVEEDLKVLMLPKDPNDEKNVVLEIRAGTGGDEATLFADEVFRMYSRYAESQSWKVEILSSSLSGVGGLKEAIAVIEGQKVYSKLKYESGVHRVQRVPATEQQGRIHTSAITVAVLPEAADVDVEIKPEEVRVDVYRSSGHGGQSVNTTDSAVRVTHLPTGLVVTCQDEKSQHKNRAKALKVLRSRLYDAQVHRQREQESAARREQVGTGDRSGRIRTYNFPQNRVTDHRIGLTLYRLEQTLEGDMDEIVSALIQDEQSRKLEAIGETKVEE